MSTGITPLSPSQVAKQEVSAAHEGYLHRVVEEADVEANVITGGLQDETISSRSARAAQRGNKFGIVMSKFLDFFQKDHGATAEAADLERAQAVEQIEKDSPALNGK